VIRFYARNKNIAKVSAQRRNRIPRVTVANGASVGGRERAIGISTLLLYRERRPLLLSVAIRAIFVHYCSLLR
jgi:hypothetical protein